MPRIQVAITLLFQSYFHCPKSFLENIISLEKKVSKKRKHFHSNFNQSFNNKSIPLLYFTPRMLVSTNKQFFPSFRPKINRLDKQQQTMSTKHSGTLERVGVHSTCVVPWPTQGHHPPLSPHPRAAVTTDHSYPCISGILETCPSFSSPPCFQ